MNQSIDNRSLAVEPDFSPPAWSRADILALASSPNTMQTARNLAHPWKWLRLARSLNHVWGTFPIRNKPPLQTQMRLSDMRSHCTCSSATPACAHLLALLMLASEHSDAFPSQQPPSWVRRLPPGEDEKVLLRPAAANAGRAYARRRLDGALEGLNLLETWLQDLVGSGFSTVTYRQKAYWTLMADRLADAHVPGAAARVQEMASLPGAIADWPDRMLRLAALLYLLIAAARRYHELPLPVCGDLHAALGWPPIWNQESQLHDSWTVIAAPTNPRRRPARRTYWLLGADSGRLARLGVVVGAAHLPAMHLAVNTILEADVEFAFAGTPLEARMVGFDRRLYASAGVAYGGHPAYDTEVAYARARAANPWIQFWPMVLAGVSAIRLDDRWYLRDQEGHALPLPSPYDHGWHLRGALLEPTTRLFGLWDGETMTPVSLRFNGRWRELATIKGIK